MRSIHTSVWLLVLSCCLLTFSALAQVVGPSIPATLPEEALTKGKPIRSEVELALVNVTVTDYYNRSVTGLEKENFRVYEDGTEQEIATFSNEDVPISIGLILDSSGSMADKVEKARQAAIQFLKAANPRDEFFLVNFSDEAQLTNRFTNSVEDLQSQMLYSTAKGSTALFDGIYLGLTQMRSARNAKHALLIISDGGDNHSRYSESDIRKFVKEADCQMYEIGVFDANDMGRTYEEYYGPTLLSELADMTGGRMFPLSTMNDLADIATKIGVALRNQYVIGYKPSDTRHDGTWRKIKVKLAPPRGLPPLNVYARNGYYAPRQ